MLIKTIDGMTEYIYRIALLAYKDCLPSTLFSFRDLIAFANEIAKYDGKNAIKVDIVSAQGGEVVLAGGMSIATRSASRVQFDALIVPGFMFTQQQGLNRYIKSFTREIRLLQRLDKKGILIAGNCVGAFLLAEAGLLDDKKVATSWLFASRLQQAYPNIKVDSSCTLITDESVITTGAFSSIHDLAFYFVRLYLGERIVRKTQNLTLTPGVGDNQNKFIDASFFITPRSPFVESIQTWLMDHLDERYSLERLASFMCVTPRTLMRRYKQDAQQTPLAFLHKQRVIKAKALLHSTDMNVDRIAEAVGYQDTNAFRKIFCREVGENPTDFRSSFK